MNNSVLHRLNRSVTRRIESASIIHQMNIGIESVFVPTNLTNDEKVKWLETWMKGRYWLTSCTDYPQPKMFTEGELTLTELVLADEVVQFSHLQVHPRLLRAIVALRDIDWVWRQRMVGNYDFDASTQNHIYHWQVEIEGCQLIGTYQIPTNLSMIHFNNLYLENALVLTGWHKVTYEFIRDYISFGCHINLGRKDEALKALRELTRKMALSDSITSTHQEMNTTSRPT